MNNRNWLWVALLVAAVAVPEFCHAAGFVKLGAGVILNDKKPGTGLSVGASLPGMPVAIEGFVDYFSKSGDTMIPVGMRIVFQSSDVTQKRRAYMGIGGGSGYSRRKEGLALIGSRTKGLVTGTFGVLIRTSPRAGVLVEGLVHRLLTSNATTDIAGRVGFSVRIGGK